MFYEITVKSHVRVPPVSFGKDKDDAVLTHLNEKYNGFNSPELGIVICVSDVIQIRDGIIIPGDGAAYYDTTYKLVVFKPELHEPVLGTISDITDFGAFLDLGATDGMIHVSQTMDDYVSFSKANILTGKETKRTLKVGERCRARIIAVSYKDVSNPKIGLTMRQPMLGSLAWIEEEMKKLKDKEEKAEKKGKEK